MRYFILQKTSFLNEVFLVEENAKVLLCSTMRRTEV